MPFTSRVLALWRNLMRRDRVERDLDDELRATFDLLVDEKIGAGMRPDDARRAARLELGSIDSLKSRVQEARAGAGVDIFSQDVRYALRGLRRAPGFAAVAIVTLALGIGANAAIFGVVKSVLLDGLPYADADRLVRVYGRTVDGSQERGPLSAGTAHEVRERGRSFERIAAFGDGTTDAVYGGDDGPQIVKVAWVEPGLFGTLGIHPALGRTFHDDEGTSGLVPLTGGQLSQDSAEVVMLTDSAWQRLFAGDPGVLGRDVRINGIPRSVIGILPRNFVGPMGGDVDVYFALDVAPVVANPITVRRSQWLGFVGRLRPGVTHDAAQSEVDSIWTELARQYPQDNASLGVATMPLRDAMVGDTRTPLLVLMASAAFVLFIACANLAGALLSRSLSRRKEFAVRMALGAGRQRLVRQLLTESLVLALAGAAAGLLLARTMLSVLRALALPLLPAYAELSLDFGAVLVTAVIAVCTGLGFGVAPALSIGRLDAQGTLRDDTRGATEGRRSRRLRGALVAGQLALCASLLTGAGLLSRSLWEMTTAPLGVDPVGVLTGAFQLPRRDYPTPEARARFLEQLTERLRLPGVDAVATASSVPTDVRSRQGFAIEGAPQRDAEPFVLFASVSDDYFRTLRIPLQRGRTFDAQDRIGTPPTVVISESMARRYWPGSDALGARIRMGVNLNAPPSTVVGIVGDVRNDPARPDAEPMAYRSSRQAASPFARVLLRTRGDPLALVRVVERQLGSLNSGIPLDRPMTLEALLGERLAARRLPVMLMVGFGAVALLLASVGIYAMFANLAAAREREFGVRLALGSRPHAIAGLMLWQGAGWMTAGLAGGAVGIVLVVRVLRDLLYGVPPFDPIALGTAVAVLIVCATVALVIPVRRATRVDPMVAVRAE